MNLKTLLGLMMFFPTLAVSCNSNETLNTLKTINIENAAQEVSQDPAPIKLRLNLKVGDEFRREFVQKLKVLRSAYGREQTTVVDMKLGVIYKVIKELNDGSYRIDVTYEYFAVNEKYEDDEAWFDSRNGDAPRQTHWLTALLVGKTMQAIVTPRGAIEGVENVAELTRAFYHKQDASVEKEITANLEKLTVFWKNVLGSYFVVFSESTVEVGALWKHSGIDVLHFEEQLEFASEFELAKLGRNEIFLKVKKEYRSPEDTKAAQGIETSGNKKGELIVSPRTGIVISGRFSMKRKTKMVMNDKEEITATIISDETIRPFQEE